MAATNKRGIFSLLDVRERQGAGTWSTRTDIWLSPSPGPGQYDFAYVAGGFNNNSPGNSGNSGYGSRIEKYDFTNDTAHLLSNFGNLDNNGDSFGRVHVSSPENHYAISGGNYFLYANEDSIFKTSYANGTSRSILVSGYTPKAESFLGASVNNTSHGYFTRGASWYDNNSSTNFRIDFSNDNTARVEKGSLTQARKALAGVGNQSYGYFGGGKGAGSTKYLASATGYSNVDRLDYSSDSTTMLSKGPLSGARGYVAATGNASYGYFAGGGSAFNSNASTIDRIDYASDTSTASPKGPMTDALWGISASGTPSYGYIFGGSTNAPSSVFGYAPSDSSTYPSASWRIQADNAKSYVQRIDFGNDTITLSPRGNLGRELYLMGSTSSRSNAATSTTILGSSIVASGIGGRQGSDTGYFAGGSPNSAYTSAVERVDYSNDTATAAAKGPLSAGRGYVGATGNQSFGYFGGGQTSPIMSKIDRIDYANDTATALEKGTLSSPRVASAAAGNTSFGYFGGGIYPSASPPNSESTVDRIDYSNDTATAVAKGPLSVIRNSLAATGNANFGYFGGGHPGPKSTVDRIDYSNDTANASPKGPLSAIRTYLSATGNADFGYFGGGDPGANSNVDRIDYSNDTATASPKGPLSVGRKSLAATGNQSFGYFGGGKSPSKSTIDRIDYSNDTASASFRGSLSAAKYSLAASSSRANAIPLKGFGFSESSVAFSAFSISTPQGTDFGYIGGGYPAKSTVERIDYSNDTATATVRGPLALARYSLSAAGNASFGYFGGGYTSSNVSEVDRINYSNDNLDASPRGPLSAAKRYMGATSNQNFGYFAGGYDNSTPILSTVDRINYSNDTATALSNGPLSVARYELAATGNQSFGYFAGGAYPDPGPRSNVDRIDYSNDHLDAAPKGNLSAARLVVSASGNADFGYFGGGAQPAASSKVDRIDYANDTVTSVEKGPLSISRESMSATGNQSFGYFAGGYTPTISTIDRIDYSNDTATAVARGPLTEDKGYTAATSSRANAIPTENIVNYAAGTVATPNTAYFGGGYPTPTSSKIERIDYSNDTATASMRGSLSGVRAYLAATGNSDFGYFGGGGSYIPGTGFVKVSTVERIDYFNDDMVALTKGPLTAGKTLHRATGNDSFGYFVGGGSPSSNLSTVDRIDYSSDTADASPKGPLSVFRNKLAATGNQDFGYFAGGQPGPRSSIDRIDYSNDTATASTKGPLTAQRYFLAATGNADFGYFGGGQPNPTVSTVERVDYANDTATAVAKGPLSSTRYKQAATGSSSFGYFGGGGGPSGKTTVDRIDYSNDTATAAVKGPLTAGKKYLGASSARANGFAAIGPALVSTIKYNVSPSSVTPQNYGYTLAYQDIVRWTFSNDNDVAIKVFSTVSAGANMPAMVSSTTHGYWNRDSSNSPQIYRLDYANDTVAPVQVGSLISNKSQAGAVHNADYGYWTGGREYPGGSGFSATSSVQRLDFSNDTANAVSKGDLSHSLKEHRGVGNMDKGYLFVGNNLTKIDYSNDTATSTSIGTGGPTPYQSNGGAAGNVDYGWFFGFNNPSTPSSSSGYNTYTGVLRLDYANDTDTLSPRGPILVNSGSRSNGATGDRNQGYFHGGFAGGYIASAMNKVVYANDTVTAQFKKALFLCPSYTFYDGNSFSAAQNGLPQ